RRPRSSRAVRRHHRPCRSVPRPRPASSPRTPRRCRSSTGARCTHCAGACTAGRYRCCRIPRSRRCAWSSPSYLRVSPPEHAATITCAVHRHSHARALRRRVGEVAVVGDQPIDVGVPGLVADLVTGPRQGPFGPGAVLVTGLGDDDQLAEWAGPVRALAEGFLAVVLAAQADEVPFGGGSAEFGFGGVEGDHVVDVAVPGGHRAAGAPAGAVTEPDPPRHGRGDPVRGRALRGAEGAGGGVDVLDPHAGVLAVEQLLAEPVEAAARAVDELDRVGPPRGGRGDDADPDRLSARRGGVAHGGTRYVGAG